MEQHGQQEQHESKGARAAEALKHEASELAGEAKRASAQLLEQRAERMFGMIEGIEHAIRAAARELENEQHPKLAGYVNRAADEVIGLRDRFQERDVGDVVHSAEQLARSRPMAALGLAFAAGFAFVRFLKSSPQAEEFGRYGDDGSQRETFGAYGTSYERPSSRYEGGQDRQSERDREMGRHGTGSYSTAAAKGTTPSQGPSAPSSGTSAASSGVGQAHGTTAPNEKNQPERSRRDPAEG